MSQDKFEERLNRINASVQPTGRKSGGGSGSWHNGADGTGQEPWFEAQDWAVHRPAEAPAPRGLMARVTHKLWSGLRGFFLP